MAKVYKITTPNADYLGVSHGVKFIDGKGETPDKWAAEMCKEAGYDVVEEGEDDEEQQDDSKPVNRMNVEELKVYAEENGIDISEATNKKEILAAIEAAQA